MDAEHVNKNVTPAKVVVRLLPPSLAEEAFRGAVKPELLNAAAWSAYVQGKRRRTFEKPYSVNSRAYLAFPTIQQAEAFCAAVHGHSFIDEKGEAFRAVADFAPYQRVPRGDVPQDRRANTYETDPLYLQFLKSRETGAAAEGSKPSQPEPESTETPQIAPLVLAVQERRQRQERLEHSQQEKKRREHQQQTGKASRKPHPVVLLHKKAFDDARPPPKGQEKQKPRKRKHDREDRTHAHVDRGTDSTTTAVSGAPSTTSPVKVLSRGEGGKQASLHILQRHPPPTSSSGGPPGRGKRGGGVVTWRPASKATPPSGS